MKYIITGSSGFVGSALCNTLERLKKSYYGIKKKNILEKDYFDSIEVQKGDVLIHLANKSFVPESWINIEAYFNINLMGTLKVLNYCKENSLDLIYISSYMYGEPDYFPIDEKHSVKANNPYALSKKMCEELIDFYGKNFNVRYNILRPFNIYGPGQKESYLIPTILNQLRGSNNDTIVLNDLNPKRDFVHIQDIADAIIMSTKSFNNDIYNISSGLSVSIRQICENFISISGISKKLVSLNSSRINEINDCYGDFSKFKNEFGWSPKINLMDGLKDCLIN